MKIRNGTQIDIKNITNFGIYLKLVDFRQN